MHVSLMQFLTAVLICLCWHVSLTPSTRASPTSCAESWTPGKWGLSSHLWVRLCTPKLLNIDIDGLSKTRNQKGIGYLISCFLLNTEQVVYLSLPFPPHPLPLSSDKLDYYSTRRNIWFSIRLFGKEKSEESEIGRR